MVRTSLSEIEKLLTSVSYSSYLEIYKDVKNADKEIVIDLSAYKEDSTATVNLKEGYEGAEGTVLLMGDDGKIVFDIDVPKRQCILFT